MPTLSFLVQRRELLPRGEEREAGNVTVTHHTEAGSTSRQGVLFNRVIINVLLKTFFFIHLQLFIILTFQNDLLAIFREAREARVPTLYLCHSHYHLEGYYCTLTTCKVAQWSKTLHLIARGITAVPGLNTGCITFGRDWESHRAAYNWPRAVIAL